MAHNSQQGQFYHGARNYPEMVTDEFLTCKICQVPGFRQPKILQCGHTFCLNCLEGVFNGHQSALCPLCRQPVVAPKGGPSKLPENLFIRTQVDRLIRRHNNAYGRMDSLYNIPNYYDWEFKR